MRDSGGWYAGKWKGVPQGSQGFRRPGGNSSLRNRESAQGRSRAWMPLGFCRLRTGPSLRSGKAACPEPSGKTAWPFPLRRRTRPGDKLGVTRLCEPPENLPCRREPDSCGTRFSPALITHHQQVEVQALCLKQPQLTPRSSHFFFLLTPAFRSSPAIQGEAHLAASCCPRSRRAHRRRQPRGAMKFLDNRTSSAMTTTSCCNHEVARADSAASWCIFIIVRLARYHRFPASDHRRQAQKAM